MRGGRLVLTLVLIGAGGAAGAQASAAPAAPPKAATCDACHGPQGRAVIPANPILAGQNARYLYLQLKDFKAERRSDPQMSPMAADLSSEEMHQLSDWYAQQKPPRQDFAVDAAKARQGKAKADETLCTMCHLGEFVGQNEVPRVAGQNHDYVVKQLKAFKAKTRTNDAGTMTSVAGTLTDDDIENIAQYIVGL